MSGEQRADLPEELWEGTLGEPTLESSLQGCGGSSQTEKKGRVPQAGRRARGTLRGVRAEAFEGPASHSAEKDP